MKLLGEIGEMGIDELFVAGITKYFEEKFISGTPIGNGNIVSGIAKLVIGSVMPKKNKYIKAVATGFGIDGVEDILTAIFSGNFGIGLNQESQGGVI